MRERDIEDYLVKRVVALGGEVRKVKWLGRRGAPDRMVLLPERSRGDLEQRPPTAIAVAVAVGSIPELKEPSQIWIELKAPGEKAKPHQVREHERMRKFGLRVEVVDSYEQVDEVLA